MKQTINDYIPEETLCRLTEEAFEAPAAEGGPAKRAPRILALAASLAIVVTALNFDTVYAAVRELLYFLPGSGAVAQEEPVEYWLPDQEYSAQVGDTRYLVTYLYRRGDTLAVGVKMKSTREPESGGSGNEGWMALLTEEEKLKLEIGRASCRERVSA